MQIQKIRNRLYTELRLDSQVKVAKLITEDYQHILSIDEETQVLHFNQYDPDELLDG